MIFRSGVLDNSPEHDLLTEIVGNKQILRPISIGISDFTNGSYVRVDLDRIRNNKNIVDLVKASTSIPILF